MVFLYLDKFQQKLYQRKIAEIAFTIREWCPGAQFVMKYGFLLLLLLSLFAKMFRAPIRYSRIDFNYHKCMYFHDYFPILMWDSGISIINLNFTKPSKQLSNR